MSSKPEIPPRNLAALKKEIKQLPDDYKKQLEGLDIENIYRSVEEFKKEWLVLSWLHLYVGSRGKTAKKVTEELYRLFSEFKKTVEHSVLTDQRKIDGIEGYALTGP